MTARRAYVLLCSTPDCTARFMGEPNGSLAQTRESAAEQGWTFVGRTADGCAEHPRRPSRPLQQRPRGGMSIRLYDVDGRLLYVATTGTRPSARIRVLRVQHRGGWWSQVDEQRTICEAIPDDVESEAERQEIVAREHPRFHRDSDGNLPYLNHTRIVPPQLRGTPITRLQAKRRSA
jgi:hypothetical protein